MEFLFPVIFSLFPVVGFVVVVGIIVYFYKKSRGEEITFNYNLLSGVYFFLISFLAIIALGVGIMYTIKGGMAQYCGLGFSYREQATYTSDVYDSEVNTWEYEEPGYEFEKDIEKKDIIRGITLIMVSAPILLVHTYGARILEKREEAMKLVKRIYLLIGLVIFAIIGIITLPVGIYETLQYFLTEQATDVWARIIPGEALATAIAFVPIWGYYLISYLNLTNEFGKE